MNERRGRRALLALTVLLCACGETLPPEAAPGASMRVETAAALPDFLRLGCGAGEAVLLSRSLRLFPSPCRDRRSGHPAGRYAGLSVPTRGRRAGRGLAPTRYFRRLPIPLPRRCLSGRMDANAPRCRDRWLRNGPGTWSSAGRARAGPSVSSCHARRVACIAPGADLRAMRKAPCKTARPALGGRRKAWKVARVLLIEPPGMRHVETGVFP